MYLGVENVYKLTNEDGEGSNHRALTLEKQLRKKTFT